MIFLKYEAPYYQALMWRNTKNKNVTLLIISLDKELRNHFNLCSLVKAISNLIVIVAWLIWFITTFRKILVHWKYLKLVKNKFEGSNSYFESVFNLNHYSDIIRLFLPFYSRDFPKEKSNPVFSKLGNKLKLTLRINLIAFGTIWFTAILTQLLSLFMDINYISFDPNHNIQAAYDFDYEEDYEWDVVKRSDSVKQDKSKVDGLNELYYDNGELYLVGYFKDGRADGDLGIFYANGNPQMHRTYKKGFMEGAGMNYYENGKVQFYGEYKDNLRHGLSDLFYDDGKTLFETSCWENGVPHGAFITYHKNGGIKVEGNFSRGKREGYFIHYNKNGEVIKKEKFIDDKKQ